MAETVGAELMPAVTNPAPLEDGVDIDAPVKKFVTGLFFKKSIIDFILLKIRRFFLFCHAGSRIGR
jgi:hypothetical protein